VEELNALRRQVATLTKENLELKTGLRLAQSPLNGGEKPGPEKRSNRESYERELAAFKAKLPALQMELNETFVAIHKGEVVDADSDETALAVRVCGAFPDDFVLVRQVNGSGEAESLMGGAIWGG
jgi:hypothetical protein